MTTVATLAVKSLTLTDDTTMIVEAQQTDNVTPNATIAYFRAAVGSVNLGDTLTVSVA